MGATDSVLSVESLFEADGRVIECGRTRGTVRSSGKEFDIPEVHVWTVPWYFRVSDRLLMGVNNRRADLVDNMSATLKRLRSAPETLPFLVKGSE